MPPGFCTLHEEKTETQVVFFCLRISLGDYCGINILITNYFILKKVANMQIHKDMYHLSYSIPAHFKIILKVISTSAVEIS